jgi:diguanylate cyclase (GGDEF)-like protein
MTKHVTGAGERTRTLAASHLVTTCAAFAGTLLFVALGSEVFPGALWGRNAPNVASSGLVAAFVLNIAIILFAWRRSKDLAATLAALEEADRAANRNAYLDQTTGLANRHALIAALDAASSQKQPPTTLLLLDLDHFKKINDLHGHMRGDELLSAVGTILRELSPPGSCCARLGGDEFAVLLQGSDDNVERYAVAILNRLAEPVRMQHLLAHISASAGLAVVEAGLTPQELLHRSDIAMYSAKRSGGNCFEWFDSAMELQLRGRIELEQEIREGINRSEFVPYFQPLISLGDGQLTGFEVLARWHSPMRGIVEPGDFIDVAEATGLIGTLSMSVMQAALIEARTWPANLKIAVNISPLQFRDQCLAERIVQLLTSTGFPAPRLELEITEGSLLEDRELAMTIVQSLKNAGVTISLDDFGTGYASLTQLQALPFDRIKIDKSFVSALLDDEQSAVIVGAIASLGRSLKVPITAEGVETSGIRERLSAMGCSDAQGWLFGKAKPAEAIRMEFGFTDVSKMSVEMVEEQRMHDRRDKHRRSRIGGAAA